MRKAVIVLAVFTALFVFTSASVAQTQHLILDHKEWTSDGVMQFYLSNQDGTKVQWATVEYFSYTHVNGKYQMANITVFGELVVKSYVAYDSNGYGFVVNGWLSMEKDGEWYTEENGNTMSETTYDDSGKVIGITIMLFDKNDEEVLRREVKRK